MNSSSILIDVSGLEIMRARNWVYGGLTLLIVGMLIPTGSIQLLLMLPLIAAAVALPFLISAAGRVFCALLIDSAVALGSWWLFGPVAGTDFVLLVLAAIAGLTFGDARRSVLIAAVLGAELSQIPLHFLAESSVGLPFFHAPGQVISNGEFLAGVFVRTSVLLLASVLFALVGQSLRSSRSALSASEATFRGAFERAPIGVALVSFDGSILKANREIRGMAAKNSGGSVRLHISHLFSASDYPTVEARIKAALVDDPSRIELEMTSASKDDPRFLKVALSGTELSGGEVAAVMTIEDVTDRVKDHQRLEQLVRSKDEFVASVSHELRTPLTAVVGFSNVLSDSWRELEEQELETLISDIVRESSEVASIVEDLLVIARADIGRVTLIPERIDLEQELRQVIGGLNPLHTDRITVLSDTAPVWGDPTRFRQVIRNLLSNALRYGGAHVNVWSRLDGDLVQIVVEDDGPGIEGGDPDRVFEPYVRAHENPTQPASVGLGLAVARSLARAMGGDLTYARDHGRTRFVLQVPQVELPSSKSAF